MGNLYLEAQGCVPVLLENFQEEKGTTEDEMAGWHHRLDGHESE